MKQRSIFLRALLRLVRPIWRVRRLALWSELLFWDQWLRQRQAEGALDELLHADRPILDRLAPYVERASGEPVRILEVGSGPLPCVGTSHPKRRIELVATDVLAPQYARLLKRRGIVPPVPAVYADMEGLSRHFGANSFDLVYATNCVDHAEDALRAILEMVEVTRPGGHVVMDHIADEGAQQDYAGMHQWNMTAADGSLVLWNDQARHDVNRILSGSCEVRVERVGDLVSVEIRKRA